MFRLRAADHRPWPQRIPIMNKKMKKLLLFAVAALAIGACAKVETPELQDQTRKEITFEVAKYVQTKAAGSLYDNGAFGTYSWFTTTGYAPTDFMINEEVDLVGGAWKTKNNTFYWPKTGSVEFISYSPFNGTNATTDSNPAITPTTITYTGINTADASIDYMYADKAIASKNINVVTDGIDSGYSGVPTIFRHALAKLSFNIKANFVTWTDSNTNTTTTWDVYVTSAKISGFKTTGDCTLTLNTDAEGVTIPWDKPYTTVGSNKYYVWTNLSGASAEQELIDATTYPDGVLLTTDAQELNAASGFVMPQILEDDTQKLELTIHITTHLANGLTIEEDFNPIIDIKAISTLKAWEMNQNITYTINIKPTAKADVNGQDNNPEDVTISFDPAVADWTNVNANATIQI